MRLGAGEAATLISEGQLRAQDLAEACLDQIDRWDQGIHAWAYLDPANLTAAAAALDRSISEGRDVGALAGVPVGVKDIFNLNGMPCEMGSPIWQGFTPGNDARVVHYLRMAGALFPGKTVTAEFAVHAPGPTENPHRRGFGPGTSSSGSAAAVAAYMVPVAIGTQTAGSIVRPASYCGVYGFKPSFGAVPRTGMLKTTDTLDTVGWFARNVDDLKLMFDICRVHGLDYPIVEAAYNDPERHGPPPGEPWRIGLLRGPKWFAADTETRTAVEAFTAQLGSLPNVVVTEVEAPGELDEAHAVHEQIYDRALAYYFKEEFQQHTLVSQQIYEIVERGNRLGLDAYQNGLARQNQIAASMDRLFQTGVDIVIDMATAAEAPEGLHSGDRPDHALIWSLCRLPAVSVPALTGRTGLPLGVQFISRRYNDLKILNFLKELSDQRVIPDATFPALPSAPEIRNRIDGASAAGV